jgi:hypothetical protein
MLLLTVFMSVYGSNETSLSKQAVAEHTPSANTNVQYLWAIPIQKLVFFAGEETRVTPLLPDWMREDLNIVATEFYKQFLNHADFSDLDPRDAEATVKMFREYQRDMVVNGTDWRTAFPELIPEELERAIRATTGFQKLLGKIGTEFISRMGFTGGSRMLYQARMWAEVLGPGDAVAPQNEILDGGVATGVVFTHIPNGTLGNPILELLDPRGHNPPFGKTEEIPAKTGMGIMYPRWVDRMTPPHRWSGDRSAIDSNNLLKSHRIDWVYEIGLFRYPKGVLLRVVDLEDCPFRSASDQPAAQNFYQLDVEQLISIGLPSTES